LILYAEFQFGDRVPGKSYRERENRERIDNWKVEIDLLLEIYIRLGNIYAHDESLSTTVQDNAMLPYLEKRLQLLMRWSVLIDAEDTSCKWKINTLIYRLSETERCIARVHTHRTDFHLAENHYRKALSYSKRYNGSEDQAPLLSHVYKGLCNLRSMQDNYVDAVNFAEEAYNCVAVAYNPVHSEVQAAAGALIECLIHKGDLYDANRFAQTTLDSLKDPANGFNQNSEEVAGGYHNLGRVINLEHGDQAKAEALAREGYRIRLQIYDIDHTCVGLSACLLANILRSQGKLEEETKTLYECFLNTSTRNEGPDGVNTAIANDILGGLHSELADRQLDGDTRKEQLLRAKVYSKEAVRISTKIYGSFHPQTIKFASRLSVTEHVLSEA
jgi:tetratricopeptide (TPR) repeat protein